MTYFEVFVDGVCRYAGYSLDQAANAFEEYAKRAHQGRQLVVLCQDGAEVQSVGG